MTYSAGIGIADFSFEDGEGFWEWVDLCERAGVDSIWQSDRIIGREPSLECMSTMAALAGRTRRIKFGMNVASIGLRDPVITAKACATVDVLSNGRLLPAFGVGTTLQRDYSATGIPTTGRGKRTDEGLAIMSRLWSEESVSFDGEHFRLSDASIAPRPVQQPLPLWVGGSAKAAIERTARWGTGWQAGLNTAVEVAPVIEAINARAVELGRSIDADHFGAGFGFRFGSPGDPAARRQAEQISTLLRRPAEEFQAVGDVDAIMSMLLRYRDAGAHKFILRPIASGTADMIEQTRLFTEQILPEVEAMNRIA